jgi:hypothetical protein
MPTLSPAEKMQAEKTVQAIYFQDPISLLSRLVKSEEFQLQHYTGMAEIVDHGRPNEQSSRLFG